MASVVSDLAAFEGLFMTQRRVISLLAFVA